MEEMQKIFKKFDKNGDGKISPSEVQESLGELGIKVALREVQHLIEEFDKDGDGHVDLNEFVEFYERSGLAEGRGDEKEIKDAFDLYDLDKNGLISAAELHEVMNKLGEKCTLRDCVGMISQVDEDGDGYVNFSEFKKMMGSKG